MRVAALERIRMQRNEEIGLGHAGDFSPSMQADEGIVLAYQYPAHAGLRLNLGGQSQGDGQRHILFQGAPWTLRAAVLAAMPGVDDHDEGLADRRLWLDGLGAIQNGFGHDRVRHQA